MEVFEAIRSRRTIRLFKQHPISYETLMKLIEAGRCAPSAANLQPVEYIIIQDINVLTQIYEQLAWAAYVKPKRNPPANKRPMAYIIVLINTAVNMTNTYGPVDAAAAIQNILLAAWAQGIGSCWIGSVQREKVKKILGISNDFQVDSVVALGYPDEEPTMEDCKNDSTKYYLDENNRLHVPKRTFKNITHINKYGIKPS